MESLIKQEEKTSIIREYYIDNIKYVVKATIKEGVSEDAVTKIRRMIRNDISKSNK